MLKTKLLRILFILFIVAGNISWSEARSICPPAVYSALKNQDLANLHSIYNSESESGKKNIENLLYGSFLNLDDLTYEQLIVGMSNNGDPFDQIIDRHLYSKKLEITKHISTLTAEEFNSYIQQYPRRRDIALEFLTSVVFNNLDSITYREVDYLGRTLKNREFTTNTESRTADKNQMVRDAVKEYCNIEAKYTALLNDLICIAAMQYLDASYKNVANSYSTIAIVPDTPGEIDRQLKGIVYNVVSSKQLRSTLTAIANKYCEAINSARGEFAKAANITGYPKMSLTIPEAKDLTFTSNSSTLSKIPQARQEFVSSRQTVSTIANIASCIGLIGSVVSTIGKGLYDMYAVSELADSEVAARKELLQSGYNQLEGKVASYGQAAAKNILNQSKINHNKFVDYVSSYKK